MKKVKLELSQYQLQMMIAITEAAISKPTAFGYIVSDNVDKLILASLGELYARLKTAYSPFVAEHKLKISKAQGLAFMMHASVLPQPDKKEINCINLNWLIGIIHQQTIN